MYKETRKCEFDEAVSSISENLKKILHSLPDNIKEECNEIRLRLNKPVMLTLKNSSFVLCLDGSVSKECCNTYKSTDEIMNDTFNRMCEYSVHSHLSDLLSGYITLKGGHRAGIVGTASLDKDGIIVSVKDISSINIRVAREVQGCSNDLYNSLLADTEQSILIVGAPSSGKTTVLRDLIRNISDNGKRISVIDERQEIAGEYRKDSAMNLGINTDVFSAYPKTKAITLAIRTMSPQYIAIDEISEKEEISSLINASNCGVKLIATIHASNFEELTEKPQMSDLTAINIFDKIVILKGADKPGAVAGIYEFKELKDEILRCRIFMDKYSDDWCSSVI